MRRCTCTKPDPAPISDTIKTKVCRKCKAWFTLEGIETPADLERIKQTLKRMDDEWTRTGSSKD